MSSGCPPVGQKVLLSSTKQARLKQAEQPKTNFSKPSKINQAKQPQSNKANSVKGSQLSQDTVRPNKNQTQTKQPIQTKNKASSNKQSKLKQTK